MRLDYKPCGRLEISEIGKLFSCVELLSPAIYSMYRLALCFSMGNTASSKLNHALCPSILQHLVLERKIFVFGLPVAFPLIP